MLFNIETFMWEISLLTLKPIAYAVNSKKLSILQSSHVSDTMWHNIISFQQFFKMQLYNQQDGSILVHRFNRQANSNQEQVFLISHCVHYNFIQNAFWFSIGWGLLFFIPVIVIAVKLSKYYRKMDKCEGYGEDDDDDDTESSGTPHDYDNYGR